MIANSFHPKFWKGVKKNLNGTQFDINNVLVGPHKVITLACFYPNYHNMHYKGGPIGCCDKMENKTLITNLPNTMPSMYEPQIHIKI
jgi:hypothetical protein